MVHLRIVVPEDRVEAALEVLDRSRAVVNIIHLPGAALRPEGDVILCDVAREDASIVLADLRHLRIDHDGSIAVEMIDAQLSDQSDQAVDRAKGAPGDAVIWEEVTARTQENSELTWTFLVFMVMSGLLAGVGIYLDSPILIVGAMVVGPEFGPIAGFCVAAVQRRPRLAARSFLALAVGLPAAITAVYLAMLVFQATGIASDSFSEEDHGLSNIIASPDFFAFFVAFCAGVAGMLSLTTAKSGALIGVLISVTTIPAAANIGLSAAYQDWSSWRGSMEQLAINVAAILIAGTLTLAVERAFYGRRRRRHLRDGRERVEDLPGRSHAAKETITRSSRETTTHRASS